VPEIHVPLTPLGEFTNPWHYTSGRLVGNRDAQTNVTILPPDGASLQTLRIKGNFFNKASSLKITLYRTLKDNYLISPIDVIASQTITFSSPGVFNQSLPLALSGKNVVDNTLYNYTLLAVANTPDAGSLAFISEIALLH
jgi:hypothetical protein